MISVKLLLIKNVVSFVPIGEVCCKQRKTRPDKQDEVTSFDKNNFMKDGFEKDTQDLEDDKYYSWKEVALILDRFFMYAFIFMVAVSSSVCLSILASKT